mgnify:CR=1 FL=1
MAIEELGLSSIPSVFGEVIGVAAILRIATRLRSKYTYGIMYRRPFVEGKEDRIRVHICTVIPSLLGCLVVHRVGTRA